MFCPRQNFERFQRKHRPRDENERFVKQATYNNPAASKIILRSIENLEAVELGFGADLLNMTGIDSFEQERIEYVRKLLAWDDTVPTTLAPSALEVRSNEVIEKVRSERAARKRRTFASDSSAVLSYIADATSDGSTVSASNEH